MGFPNTKPAFQFIVLLASPRDFGKIYRSPFLSFFSPLPRWLMTHLFSPSLWRASVAGTDLLYLQKQKVGARREERGAGASTPRRLHSATGLGPPPSRLHPPITPSSAPPVLAGRVSWQAPQAFYFTVTDGEQVPVAGVMCSKLSFWWLLIGQSPWGFTQTGGQGGWSREYGKCRWLVSWPVSHQHHCRGPMKARYCSITPTRWGG